MAFAKRRQACLHIYTNTASRLVLAAQYSATGRARRPFSGRRLAAKSTTGAPSHRSAFASWLEWGALPVFILKGCPKCHGDLVADTSWHRLDPEVDVSCIQCG